MARRPRATEAEGNSSMMDAVAQKCCPVNMRLIGNTTYTLKFQELIEGLSEL